MTTALIDLFAKELRKAFRNKFIKTYVGKSLVFGYRVDIYMKPSTWKANEKAIRTFVEEREHTIQKLQEHDLCWIGSKEYKDITTFEIWRDNVAQ